MDKLGPQAIGIKETDFTSNDLFKPELIDKALELAKNNPRDRAIIRIHDTLSDEQHLMINAILGESYVTPHRHTESEKTETFRIVKGRAFVVFFDDGGKVTEKVELGEGPDDRKIVTVRFGKWHTFVPMSAETVILEAKRQPSGGYNPVTDKEMASWAPSEKDIDGGQVFLKNLKARLDKVGE